MRTNANTITLNRLIEDLRHGDFTITKGSREVNESGHAPIPLTILYN